jgi:membrane-associated protease RseP (regulator of RpoE activity)
MILEKMRSMKEVYMRKALLFAAVAMMMAIPIWAGTVKDLGMSDSWLGVYTQTVDNDLKDAFNLSSDHGVVIKQIIPDSPADKAGLRTGDIILKLDGTALTSSEQLAEMVGNHNPGDKINLEVISRGKTEDLDVTVGSRSDDRIMTLAPGKSPGSALNNYYTKLYSSTKSELSDSYIGVNLQSMTKQLGEYFGVKDGNGVLVAEVMDDSPASKAGLKAGDIIVALDGNPVSGPSDVQKAIRDKEKGDKVTLGILRDKVSRELAVEVDESPDNYFGMSNLPQFPGLDEDYFFAPSMRGLLPGNFDNDAPDLKSMQETIEKLQKQMEEMQKKFDATSPKPDK